MKQQKMRIPSSIRVLYLAARKRMWLGLGKRYRLVKRFNGLFLLDLMNYIDRQIEAFGNYEKEQVDFFLRSLQKKRASSFIDIGAHWGWYSLRVALRQDMAQVRIVAFEPDAVNRAQLWANIFLNRLQDRITVVDWAVSESDGYCDFHRHVDENRGRSVVMKGGEQRVKTLKLDSFWRITGESIGVKIDVEGHEVSVLSGMQETLQANECFIQVEAFGDSAANVEAFLRRFDYEVVRRIGDDYFFEKVSVYKDCASESSE